MLMVAKFLKVKADVWRRGQDFLGRAEFEKCSEIGCRRFVALISHLNIKIQFTARPAGHLGRMKNVCFLPVEEA